MAALTGKGQASRVVSGQGARRIACSSGEPGDHHQASGRYQSTSRQPVEGGRIVAIHGHRGGGG
jgi:hypothetical protein